jgi:hypothetical protein
MAIAMCAWLLVISSQELQVFFVQKYNKLGKWVQPGEPVYKKLTHGILFAKDRDARVWDVNS